MYRYVQICTNINLQKYLKPNVIPGKFYYEKKEYHTRDIDYIYIYTIIDYVSGKFVARSLKYDQLVELKQKLENCFQSAADATGCKVKITWDKNGEVKGKKKSLVVFFSNLYPVIDTSHIVDNDRHPLTF